MAYKSSWKTNLCSHSFSTMSEGGHTSKNYLRGGEREKRFAPHLLRPMDRPKTFQTFHLGQKKNGKRRRSGGGEGGEQYSIIVTWKVYTPFKKQYTGGVGRSLTTWPTSRPNIPFQCHCLFFQQNGVLCVWMCMCTLSKQWVLYVQRTNPRRRRGRECI